KLTSQEDKAIQAYDQSAQELGSANAQLALVNREVATDRAQFRQMRAEIAQIATTAYESGNMNSMGALLTTDNPQAVLSQASVLLQLSSDRSAQVNHFLSVARQLEGAQRMTRRTQTAIAALNKQRLARKQSIGKAVSSQKAILATLTAQQQTTVIGAGGTTSARYTGSTATQAGKAVAYAYSKLGDPYSYGAAGPGAFDCSGLTSAAWAYAGITIPRTSYSQAGAGYPSVPKANLQPGDLVFFNGDSHVGLYVGGGDMIDAPTTGSFVEKVSLSGSWYVANYDGAVRP
ncbi:MAG: peptidoglycan DL-endopeptidase CwlO, partial [Streptosporangiaceae bacterium]|nr:peptidoglycan DL-endopeptidase CwlO [Streptosporangiaceae bacterium]